MLVQDAYSIDGYMSDLHIQVLNAGFTRCKRSWGCHDLKPEYNKLYYILEGEGRIRIGDREYEPQPGQLFFIPAGTVHSFWAVSDNTFLKYWCHFTSNVVFAPMFKYYNIPYAIQAAGLNEIEQPFLKLADSITNGLPSRTLQMKAAIFEIVSHYVNLSVSEHKENAATVSPLSIRKLQSVIDYIDSHLDQDIKLGDLADIVHYHNNYVIKYFKTMLGVTPMQYIYNRRLEKAKSLLATTDLALSEVASCTGFSDLCHFSRSFKKHLGVSPRQFRVGGASAGRSS